MNLLGGVAPKLAADVGRRLAAGEEYSEETRAAAQNAMAHAEKVHARRLMDAVPRRSSCKRFLRETRAVEFVQAIALFRHSKFHAAASRCPGRAATWS